MALNKMFNERLLAEKLKYANKLTEQVKSGKRGSSYSALKKMSLFHEQSPSFYLPQHVASKLSPDQSAERIAQYFSSISPRVFTIKL